MPNPAHPPLPAARPAARCARLFPALLGAFLGLLLLKFGSTPIMEQWIHQPQNAYELILGYPWPTGWAYLLLAAVTLAGSLGLIRGRWRTPQPKWLLVLPAIWLVWQFAATSHTLNPTLSSVTVAHFTAAVICFYLGALCLGTSQPVLPVCLGLACGFALVLVEGWQQHFGGLEATRTYFFQYIYPMYQEAGRNVPAEYIKKLSSTRIFSTLFYPNSLAGALLLLLPAVLAAIWELKTRFTPAARGFLVGALSLGGLACLFWSGSKGGWLLMLLLGLLTLLHLPFARKYKLLLISALLVAGLAGFFWKYAGFFQKGATSVGARFDYWQAGLRIIAAQPLLGTGPGTFGLAYAKIKRPESEPTRLAHNDYLQQAADSGVPGFLAYACFIAGCLVWSYPGSPWPRGAPHPRPPPGATPLSLRYAIWLGVLGWALQGLMEFTLYLPALAWTAFTLLGWLTVQPRRRHEGVPPDA